MCTIIKIRINYISLTSFNNELRYTTQKIVDVTYFLILTSRSHWERDPELHCVKSSVDSGRSLKRSDIHSETENTNEKCKNKLIIYVITYVVVLVPMTSVLNKAKLKTGYL